LAENNYRFDNRSKEQFASDIAKCTAVEKELMIFYVDWLNKNLKDKGQVYTFTDNGIDNSGKLLADNEVDSRPDFVLHSPKGKKHFIEIKFSIKSNPKFHIKMNHVRRCIDEDICIVMFMDIEGKNKRFCILTPSKFKKLLEDPSRIVEFKPWGYKECLRILDGDVDWNS
jgi:hypothetical protein